MPNADKEFSTIRRLEKSLKELDQETQQRVLTFVISRLGVNKVPPPQPPAPAPDPGAVQR